MILPEQVDELRQRLTDPDPAVRLAAADAILEGGFALGCQDLAERIAALEAAPTIEERARQRLQGCKDRLAKLKAQVKQ